MTNGPGGRTNKRVREWHGTEPSLWCGDGVSRGTLPLSLPLTHTYTISLRHADTRLAIRSPLDPIDIDPSRCTNVVYFGALQFQATLATRRPPSSIHKPAPGRDTHYTANSTGYIREKDGWGGKGVINRYAADAADSTHAGECMSNVLTPVRVSCSIFRLWTTFAAKSAKSSGSNCTTDGNGIVNRNV